MTASAPAAAARGRGIDILALMPWVIGLVTGIDYFDNALFAFFASYIAGGVNASADELVWASSAYALGAVLGILQQHAWVERLGYRRYLAICMFAFAVGGVAAACSDNSVQLMLARGFQGYFVGPMLGACRILIQLGIPPQRRPKALRSFMILIVFGGAMAPIAGAGHAIGEAHAMALASLARVLEQQATFMASLDGFHVMAVAALLAGLFAAWQREID